MAKGKDKTEQRRERLAKALKANLARRKAQEKSRDADPPPANGPDAEEGCRN